ncbi:PFP-BETA2, partial [Symbiodinium microadriaticum]
DKEEEPPEVQDGQVSIFDSLPGFGSFVPSGVSNLFAEDTRVPVAKAIPTPKKTKPPPLPEAAPPPLSSQVPWSMQLKSADPDWYDPDDAEYSGPDDFPDVGEVPGAPAPKGRAEGVSAVQGVTEDVFSSPIHRREAVAHPPEKRDPRPIRAFQTPGGLDLIEQAAYDGCETSLAQVDSISGEVARSWVRYTYARDRAVGFSEFWRPLRWTAEEWERRLIASGNLRRRGGIGVMKHGKAEAEARQASALRSLDDSWDF